MAEPTNLNNVESLRQLLLELYVSGQVGGADLSEAEQARLLDTVLDAAEGRRFKPLGLPFPRATAFDGIMSGLNEVLDIAEGRAEPARVHTPADIAAMKTRRQAQD